MNELESVERAITALEAQRGVLGDEVVDTALAPLREKRATLIARATAEQRKQVTVLFADVVDFTVLSQELDPEDTRAVIGSYFQSWQEQIEAQGGVVEKFIGDAVMAVFGLRRSHEDDPHRAIRAALGMQAALRRFNEERTHGQPITLQMRVGIDTGDVVVSSLDERSGQDFVVVGETVNRAARIQSAAPAGGILISRDTHRLVRGWFGLTRVEPLRLKGIAEPVEAFLVGLERPAGFRLDEARGVEGVDTRTIGRDASLRQLQDHFWDVIEERRWRVVTIVGDPGVGKSRLLVELDRWLAEIDQRVYWFRGRASPSTQNVPNRLLRDVVAARLDITERDSPAAVREKLETGFATVFGSGETERDQAHLVGHWLGFDLRDSDAVAGLRHDSAGLGQRASGHLAEYFGRLADEYPVVILLEDLHWADEGTLAWIDAADDILRSRRVLVVGTARPALLERHQRWGEGLQQHVRLPLAPLSRRESARLLEEILQRAEEVPASVTELLVGTAEGNPFHLEELVKWLVDSQVIVKVGDVWQVHEERIPGLRVPPTLKGVLQSRIDALTLPEQLVLQRASVIGRVFWDGAVDGLSTGPAPALRTSEALDHLRAREIVYQRPQSTFEATEEFLFKHAVLRDVTYESVLRSQRQQYHRLAARWLERMTEPNRRADEYAALIALHYDSSGDALAAAGWYARAAAQASSIHALAEASRLLDRAIELVPDEAPEVRFDALLAREDVADRMGDRDAQQRDLEALELLTPRVDDARRVRLLLRWAAWRFLHSEYDEEAVPARAAVELARAAGRVDLEADALLWWGRGLTWKGAHAQAKEVLGQALVKAREAEQTRLVGETLRYLAIVANNESEFPRAIVLLEQAGAAHRANNDLEGETMVLIQLGSVLFNQGQHREARVWLERSLPVIVASGHKYRQAVVTSNLGAILLQEGELGEARRLIVEGLRLCEEIEDREGVAVALALLGDTYRRAGDHERAQDYLHRSLDASRTIEFDFQASDAALCLGLDLLDASRVDKAVPWPDVALEHARSAESPLAETRAHLGRAFTLAAVGLMVEAGAAAREARDGAKRLALDAQVLEAGALLARIAARQGDLPEAVRLIEQGVGAIDDDMLVNTLRPGELLLARWEIFVAAGHPEADEALRAGLDFLDSFAARIDEPDLRAGFLDGIPAHRALAAARTTSRGSPGRPEAP